MMGMSVHHTVCLSVTCLDLTENGKASTNSTQLNSTQRPRNLGSQKVAR